MNDKIDESEVIAQICSWRCEFVDPELEQTYLQRKLAQDKKIAQFLALVIAGILLLIMPFDGLIIKSQYWPHPMLEWRVLIMVFSVAAAVYVNYVTNTKQLKYTVCTYVVLFLLNLQLMVLSYKDHYVLHVFFDVIIIIVVYFSTLLSLRVSSAICIAYALVGSFTIMLNKTIDMHTTGMVLIAYTSANIVGIVISNQEHKLRRNLYLRKLYLREVAQTMQSFAFRDALTNIANRRSFDDRFDSYCANAKRLRRDGRYVGVAICDIDFFKKVNDTFGHDVGDEVLIKFAQFIADSIRPNDDVYRFGGEEFVLMLIEVNEQEAIAKINRLITALNERVFTVPQIDYPITASFGLAFLQEDESAKEVIARADAALYKAKAQGRNRVCVDNSDVL